MIRKFFLSVDQARHFFKLDKVAHFALCYILADLMWTIPTLRKDVPVEYAALCLFFIAFIALIFELAGNTSDPNKPKKSVRDIDKMDMAASLLGGVVFFVVKLIQHFVN